MFPTTPIVVFMEHSHLTWAVLFQELGPKPLTNFAFAINLLPPGLENESQQKMSQDQTFHDEIVRVG